MLSSTFYATWLGTAGIQIYPFDENLEGDKILRQGMLSVQITMWKSLMPMSMAQPINATHEFFGEFM